MNEKYVKLYIRRNDPLCEKVVEIFDRLKIRYKVIDVEQKFAFGGEEVNLEAYFLRDLQTNETGYPILPTALAGRVISGLSSILNPKNMEYLLKEFG